MKNTLENKAKFFALYWEQKILKDKAGQTFNVCSNINLKHESWFIELKPLSQISDEDALWYSKQVFVDEYVQSVDEEILIQKIKKANHFNLKDPYRMDYLRSKGYALPWLDISIEEQIEFGWIVLKTK